MECLGRSGPTTGRRLPGRGYGEKAVSGWVLGEGACAEGGVGVELSQVMFALCFHAKRTHLLQFGHPVTTQLLSSMPLRKAYFKYSNHEYLNAISRTTSDTNHIISQ